ncbi:MAG: transglycosylase domain-containing protein, partial [Acidimicrobiales bacterium]
TVKGAVLASEDVNFYRHNGVNVRSVARAASANLDSGGVAQGGSTITQQVVKNSLVGNERNLSRKLREAFLAVELEKQMPKDEILGRYLNSVYFGNGAYGVAAASEYYFRKDVQDLDWAEGALLAALIPSPNTRDPFRNPKVAKERRHIVFTRLMNSSWEALGPTAADKAGHQPGDPLLTVRQVALYDGVAMPTNPAPPRPPDDYFVEQVKKQLLDDPSFNLGTTPAARNQAVFSGGIRVYTTFDPDLQLKAKSARDATLPNNNCDGTFPVIKGPGQVTYGTQAIASVEPSTGAVRVLVGGPGYDRDKSQADLTGLPGRQPGSSMKVFTLAALLDNGYVPADTVSGRRCRFAIPGQLGSKSFETHSLGYGTITTMIQYSSNCGFMRLAQLVGNDKIVDMAHRLGVRTSLVDEVKGNPIGPPFGLTLGSKDIPVIDMAAAYSVFANDGVRNPMYFVERIEDANGKVIYQHQAEPEQVVSVETARLIDEVLVNNVERGTGENAKLPSGQPAAGKTGTTNESTNVWFVGYTPQLSTAVWMGVPTGNISLASAGLEGATGGAFPAKTWGAFYQAALAGKSIEPFPVPPPTRPGQSVGRIPNEIGGSGFGRPQPGQVTTVTPPGQGVSPYVTGGPLPTAPPPIVPSTAPPVTNSAPPTTGNTPSITTDTAPRSPTVPPSVPAVPTSTTSPTGPGSTTATTVPSGGAGTLAPEFGGARTGP